MEREFPALVDRLIVMSALAESEPFKNGAPGSVLQKPFDAVQLLAAIDSVLNRLPESSLR